MTVQASAARDVAAEAAIHWRALAVAQIAQDTWEAEHGRPLGNTASCYRARADVYYRTAEALRREAATGKPHCSACGGEHQAHEHGYPFGTRPCKCGLPGCPWCRNVDLSEVLR